MRTLTYQISISKASHTIVAIDQFEIPLNQVTFLFGESGIGKTIICKAVYGLLETSSLDIRINDLDYQTYLAQESSRAIRRKGFFVFQEPSTHLNPLLTLKDQLKEGSLQQAKNEREILHHLWNTDQDSAVGKILEVYPKPYRPSGGEKQRVLLAMAFKKMTLLESEDTSPENLFIFDEPTGNLDNQFRNLFLQLLFGIFQQRPFTAVVITHDYSMISEVYHRYRKLLRQISFKELSRKHNHLILQSFEANDYLDWLKQEKKLPSVRSSGGTTILRIAGGYEVFGKKMILSRDQTRHNYGLLEIKRGEMIYLKAASGVGKTTLAKIIMGLTGCRNLSMKIGDWEITEHTPKKLWRKHIWGKKIGMVFQHADEALNLNAPVKEVFKGLPLRESNSPEYIRKKLMELFDDEISPDFLKKKVGLLSGGQKQRLNLLRTLLLDTDLIILDEPLNGLDFLSIKKIVRILQEKQRQGKAILMISHNEEIFEAIIEEGHIYYLFSA